MKAAFSPGTTFANYRVESLLGRGGMGVVYRATDLSLERPVALKLIAPELAQDAQFRARFLREPRLAASLDHPNVIPIYEAGEHEGQLYLAMRYVEGTDLKSTLERDGKLTPASAIELLAQVASALDAAHERGLVHRDVKPGNILIDRSEHVYLTDFGITKQTGSDSTETGSLVGTLDYLAPEQIRGEPVDGRTDCYALACVLYECLAGNPPFRRATEAETLWAHMQDEPRPLPGGLGIDGVLARGLAKDPERRYASCAELVEAAGDGLGVGLGGRAGHAPSRIRSARRGAWLIAASGVLLLAAALAAGLASLGGGGDSQGLTAVAGDSVAAIDPATNRIVAQYPVGGTPTTVAVGAGAVWTVNADGQTISRIDTRGGKPRTFAIGAVPIDLAASRDAVWAVASDRGTETGQQTQGPATLARLESRSGAVTDSYRLRPSSGHTFVVPPQLVAAGSGAVWVFGRTRRLHRVDQRSGDMRVVPGPRVSNIATGDGQVWALADRPRGNDLVRLDPRTGAIRRRIRLPDTGFGPIAVGAGAVWLTDAFAGVVWRVDTAGQPVQRTIDVEGGVDSVAVGAGAVWAGNSVAGTVTRIDPATNAVKASIALGNTPRSVGVGGGRVWVTVVGGADAPVPAGRSLSPGAEITPLAERTCGPVLTGRDGDADVLVPVDLPLQGESQPTTASMAAATAFVLRRQRFRAGRFRVAVQTCDDSTAIGQLPFDTSTCTANAKAYAANPSVVGVLGPVHSGCAERMLPILGRADAGPLALVSPANTAKYLVRADPLDAAGALQSLYPAGQRGYARILPTEDYEVAAAALLARRLGDGSVFYLEDNFTAELGYRNWFRRAARLIGLRIAGTAVWDAQARDYRRIAERVRVSGVRAVYLLGHLGTNAQQMVRDLRAVLGRSVEIIGYSGLTPISELFEEAGPAARGVHVLSAGVPLERVGPAGRRFVRAFGRTQPGGRVTTADLYAAAATETMLDAIARSDGSRASVTGALRRTRLRDTVVGPLAFNRFGEPVPSPITVARAERGDHSREPIFFDLSGAVLEDVITPPARLVETP